MQKKMYILGYLLAISSVAAVWLEMGAASPKPKVQRPHERPAVVSQRPSRELVYVVREATAVQPPESDTADEQVLVEEPEEAAPSAEETAVILANSFNDEVGSSDLAEVETEVVSGTKALDIEGATLQRIECRRTICQMRHSFADEEASRRYFDEFVHSEQLDQLFHSMGLSIPEIEVSESGSVEVVSYLQQQ